MHPLFQLNRSVVQGQGCKAVLAQSSMAPALQAAVPELSSTPKGAPLSCDDCPSLQYVVHDGVDNINGMLNLRNILCYSSDAVSSDGAGDVIAVRSCVCLCLRVCFVVCLVSWLLVLACLHAVPFERCIG